MALLHDATLRPTKLELLAAWLPSQQWWTDPAADSPVEAIGSYRFDDPADEVGVETYLLRARDGVVQVPLTYRGSPLAGAEPALLGTLQHSALGERWVYDGCTDPVYATALATAIVAGGSQAQLQVLSAGQLTVREPAVRVKGSGEPGTPVAPIGTATSTSEAGTTTIATDELTLTVLRRPTATTRVDGALVLTGTWPGSESPCVLALARPR